MAAQRAEWREISPRIAPCVVRAHAHRPGGGGRTRGSLPHGFALRRKVLHAHGGAAGTQAAWRHARGAGGAAPVLSLGRRAKARAHRKIRLTANQSTSWSSWALRASRSRFILIHSPSLRRSRLPPTGFFAS